MVFYISLLFLFILPFLDGGTNFLAEVLILTLPFPLFLIGISRKEFSFDKLPLGILGCLGIFGIFAGISVVFSSSQTNSIPEFFKLLGILVWFGIFLGTNKTYESNKIYKEVTGLILLVSCVLSLVSLYYLLPGVSKPSVGMNLVYASYGHNHLADVLLMAIPITLTFFLTAKDKKSLVGWGGLGLFYLVSFILTFSRGAFLVLPIVLILVMVLIKPQRVWQKFFGWFFILMPLGFVCLLGLFSLSQFGREAVTIAPNGWLTKQLVKPDLEANRFTYWREALLGIKEKPIFGVGLGNFKLVSQKFQNEPSGWSVYAHNFYLQVFVEIGIFGLLGMLGFLGITFWQIVKKIKEERNPFLIGGFGAILASSLHSFLDFDWSFPAVFLLYLLILSYLIKRSGNEIAWSPVKNFFRNQTASAPRFKRFLKNLTGSPHLVLLLLSLIVFLFAQIELLSEYFAQKEDNKMALMLAPWPGTRVQTLATKTDFESFPINLSKADPSTDLWLGDRYFKENNLTQAGFYYQKAIDENPIGNFPLYPKLGRIYDSLGQKEKKDKLFFSLREKLNFDSNKNYDGFAKTCYQIGLDLLKEGKGTETIFWWQHATNLSPQWSYFHIELASLFFKMGDFKNSKTVLSNCLNFYFPKILCQQYLDRLSLGQSLETPGFYEKKINQEVPSL